MKNESKKEPLRIIRKEQYEDEEFVYIIDYLSDGGIIKNKHPKHPKRSKEEIFEELGPIMIAAWDHAQVKKTKEAESKE